MNRRDLLCLIGAISFLSTSTRVPAKSGQRKRSDESVIVVGAGVAGLGAARTLLAAGHQVVVLEGRDRTGGRLWTSRQWADAPIDLGAATFPRCITG